MDTIHLLLYPAHHSCRVLQLWTLEEFNLLKTQRPPLIPTPSPPCPLLLVLQCALLADKEFMLWPLFTGKNVPTCVGRHAFRLSEKNACYFCLGCSVCHLHAMLHRGFCCKLFALGDVQANADTFYDASFPSMSPSIHIKPVFPTDKNGESGDLKML